MSAGRTPSAEAILALTLYGEAAAYNTDDAEKIAATPFNRVDDPGWWGREVSSACLHPWQYSCWNWAVKKERQYDQGDAGQRARLLPFLLDGKPGTPDVAAVEAAQGWLGECLRIARRTWDLHDAPGWRGTDPSRGATSYYASYIPAPSWAKAGPQVARSAFKVGGKDHGHLFYAIRVNGRASEAPRSSPIPRTKPSDVGKTAGGAISGGGLVDQLVTGGEGLKAAAGFLRAIFLNADGSPNAVAFGLLFLALAAGVAWWIWRDWRLRRGWSARAPWMDEEDGASTPPSMPASTPSAPAIPAADAGTAALVGLISELRADLAALRAENEALRTPKTMPRRRPAAKP